jgi:hypothetical protein
MRIIEMLANLPYEAKKPVTDKRCRFNRSMQHPLVH